MDYRITQKGMVDVIGVGEGATCATELAVLRHDMVAKLILVNCPEATDLDRLSLIKQQTLRLEVGTEIGATVSDVTPFLDGPLTPYIAYRK